MNFPPRAANALIHACLASPADPRREAWRVLGSTPEVLSLSPVVQAGLGPQLLHAASVAKVEIDPGLRSRLRAARAHEELRVHALEPACRNAIDADVVVLRGVALAHTAYDDHSLRHCHDLDLLAATDALEAPPGGFPVSRHRSLFGRGHPPVGLGDLDDDATSAAEIAGVTARVLAPAESLVHVCAHAATIGVRESPLWPVDAALLVRRAGGSLDWGRVIERAAEWRFVGAVTVALAWLRREFQVPVPPATLRDLRRRRLRRIPRRLLRLGPG